jgi:hypothetical protein
MTNFSFFPVENGWHSSDKSGDIAAGILLACFMYFLAGSCMILIGNSVSNRNPKQDVFVHFVYTSEVHVYIFFS